MNAFSPAILPKIKEKKVPVHLDTSSEPFFSALCKQIDHQAIRSLRLNLSPPGISLDLLEYRAFNRLASLHLVNASSSLEVERWIRRFPSVTHVSLWFDDELDLLGIFDEDFRIYSRVTHLYVHGSGMRYCRRADWDIDGLVIHCRPIDSVQYCLIDLDHYAVFPIDDCRQHGLACFLQQIVTLVQRMVNVQGFQLRVTSHHMQTFLQGEPWQDLILSCERLNKIILHVFDIVQDETLEQRVREIEQELQQLGPNISFRLKLQ